MKRHIFLSGMALAILTLALAAFGQTQSERTSSGPGQDRQNFMMFQLLSPEETADLREKWPNMSEQEKEKFRAQMREKWENLSDEERERLRSQTRGRMGVGRRGAMSSDEQLNAIKSIETQLAKLKENIQSRPDIDGRSFRDLPETERTKISEQLTKARQDREKALQAIIAQIAMLQNQRIPQASADDTEYIIVNIGDLKQIQNSAEKEKATDTAQRLERLISRARGQGPIGRIRPDAAVRPQDGTRPPRPRRDSGN